jgi:hypothetical protein
LFPRLLKLFVTIFAVNQQAERMKYDDLGATPLPTHLHVPMSHDLQHPHCYL